MFYTFDWEKAAFEILKKLDWNTYCGIDVRSYPLFSDGKIWLRITSMPLVCREHKYRLHMYKGSSHISIFCSKLVTNGVKVYSEWPGEILKKYFIEQIKQPKIVRRIRVRQ